MSARIILVTLAVLVCGSLLGQAPDLLYQFVADGGGGVYLRRWVYVGGDEFDGAELNESLWKAEMGTRVGNGELQCYRGLDNIEVAGGTLRIIAKDEPGYYRAVEWLPPNEVLSDGEVNNRYFQYTSGAVDFRQKFKGGLFWSGIKPPYGKGMWPAFWLYGGNPNEEFDIFEGKGERPDEYSRAVHCPGQDCQNTQSWISVSGDLPLDFNSFFGEWGPNAVFYYFNNSDAGGYLASLYYQADVILNLAISGYCECLCCDVPFACPCCLGTNPNPLFCGGPDGNTTFPRTMEVDFARFYSLYQCTEDVSICSYSSGGLVPTVLTGRTLTVGGSGCAGIVTTDNYLTLVASEAIVLDHGFDAQNGAVVDTKFVPCLEPGQMGLHNGTTGLFAEINRSVNRVGASVTGSDSPVLLDVRGTQKKEPEARTNDELVSIAPIPVFDMASIQSHSGLILRVDVSSAEGRLIASLHAGGVEQLVIQATDWHSGVYYATVSLTGNRVARIRLVKS